MTEASLPATAFRKPAILVLGAGLSRRMAGADKLMEEVQGTPLIRRACESALATGHSCFVTLPPPPHPRWEALTGLDVHRVTVADPALGMGASLAAGVRALSGHAGAVLIHLADMPEIGPEQMQSLLAARAPENPGQIIRGASEGGQAGHPVLFGAAHFEALSRLNGDRGAQAILANAPQVDILPLQGEAALTDLDTPQAWADWRAANPQGIS
ncbi:nucleotidyltransferase family protein [Alphaproteobacteria bacterium KMM 3653]|uniref:Nucleotidyltransferase family protein n=1 Tax=Harenicola maris TaxID=2841044 RepID=A0AAP2CNI7_9RHOB|nr:nucleotidyltransferase family protein [Harenicola maris]